MLDAGDTIHGLPFATLDKGKSVARLMEAAGYLAMTPGNHDFNYGTDYLREFRQEAGFAVLLPMYWIKQQASRCLILI